MSGPQLPHLETFVKVAELSSFTAAAHALDRTQAAVSQRVQALEGELGVSLFHRRGNGVLLTDAGRRLYPVAQQILRLYEEARAAVTGQPAPVQGELSLGASSVPGEHLLPALLSPTVSATPTSRSALPLPTVASCRTRSSMDRSTSG